MLFNSVGWCRMDQNDMGPCLIMRNTGNSAGSREMVLDCLELCGMVRDTAARYTTMRNSVWWCEIAGWCETVLFATSFSDKISKLHFNLQTNPSSTPVHSLPPLPPSLLHFFTPATLLEIDNLLSQFSDSYCDLDRVKENFQRNISNYPLNSKSFHNHWYLPFHLKIIDNQPTVKKPSLNKEDLSNYRPISNLSFISKLTEKL